MHIYRDLVSTNYRLKVKGRKYPRISLHWLNASRRDHNGVALKICWRGELWEFGIYR